GGDEDTRGDDHRVQPAVGQHHVVEDAGHALAAGDVAGEADGRPAVAEAGAGHADAGTLQLDDLVRGRPGRPFAPVDAPPVPALPGQAVGAGLADPGPRADHGDDLAVQLLLRRQPEQLGLLERAVLDVERLPPVHRLVAI